MLCGDRSFLSIFRQVAISLAAGLVCWIGFSLNQAARAESETVVVNLPVPNQLIDIALIAEAEAVAKREVSRRFSQNSTVFSIAITILGDSNGEVAPILSAVVSRSQWMENPDIDSWLTHYDAAYQLFQRHDEEVREEIIAGIPIRSTLARNGGSDGDRRASQSRKLPGRLLPWQVHEAYDSGRLSGDEVQRYIDDLD